MTAIDAATIVPAVPASARSLAMRPSLLDTIDGHANNYTLIRLLLAASVIYFHSYALVGGPYLGDPLSMLLVPVTSLGGLAVQCFFLLSGLFVTQSFYRDPSVIRFAIRRAARIWPGLFVCLLVTTAIGAILSQGINAWRLLLLPDIHDYLANNGRLKMDFFVTGIYENTHSKGLNGSLYTLPVEVGLYVVIALAGLLGALKHRTGIVVLAAALLGIAWLNPGIFTKPLGIESLGQPLIAMFFFGCLLFGIAGKIRISGWQVLPLGILAWASTGLLHTCAFFAMATWIMLYVGQQPTLRRWLPLQRDLSFGVYIYGYPCQQMIISTWPEIRPIPLLLTALPLALLFAALSWRWVEAPGIRLGRDLAARWRWPAQSNAAADVRTSSFWPRGSVWMASLIGVYLLINLAAWITRQPA